MAIAKIDFRLPWVTTAPRGPLSSNTFYCDTGVTSLDASLAASLAALFNQIYNQTTESWLSSLLDGDNNWSVYDMADAPGLLPINFGTFAVTPGADTLPAENAINLGFRAPRVVGVPRQRARGRVSLGPLCLNALDSTTGLLTAAVVDQVEQNVTDILTDLNSGGATWVVGSSLHGFNDIERLTISNEIAQVHRRQLAATDQTVILVP